MTPKRKLIVWSVITSLLVGLAYVIWGVASMRGRLRDCYGQWDTAELIIRFHRERHRFPVSWPEIGEVYGDGSGLHGGLSAPQLQQNMIVDFTHLGELEALARNASPASSLPEIVRPKSGQQSHWAGAEPNKLIYDYFRENLQKQ